MSETVVCNMKEAYKCKHSVRFNPINDSDKEVCTGFYLPNVSYEKLGEPDTIVIGVTAND